MNKLAKKDGKQYEVQSVPKNKAKPRKPLSLQKQKSKMGWLFISPFLVGFFLIYLPMIIDSIRFAFSKINIQGGSGYTLEFVGWENFEYAILTDAEFTGKLGRSVVDLAISVPTIVIFSLFMAIMLNQKMKGRAAFRAIFFIPVIVSTGIIASIDFQNAIAAAMETTSAINEGGKDLAEQGTEIISSIDVSRYLRGMVFSEGLVDIIVDLVNNVYNLVNRSGVQMLIFLAGLQSISPAIYESCHIDGASAWETFWKITIPMISPMILVNSIYTVIDSFTSKSNEVMLYISQIYSGGGQGQERSTAMAWIYFLIVMLILAIISGLMSAYVFYQRRDT